MDEHHRAAVAHHLRAGLPSIPVCAPRPNGRCSAPWHKHAAQQAGKVPMVEKYPELAHEVPELEVLVARHFTWLRRLAYNLAIVVPNGYVVVEADSPDADAEVAGMLGAEMTACRAARPGRGRAWIFRVPTATRVLQSRVGLGASRKIDVRGPGAILVVPPSIHYTGHQYRWEVTP